MTALNETWMCLSCITEPGHMTPDIQKNLIMVIIVSQVLVPGKHVLVHLLDSLGTLVLKRSRWTVDVLLDWAHRICDPLNNLVKSHNNQIFYGCVNWLTVWLVAILWTTGMKTGKNDLTLKVTGSSQQAVDVVRRTVGQGERQQLLPGLQVSVSFALAEQTAHIPGSTVAWKEEKPGDEGQFIGYLKTNFELKKAEKVMWYKGSQRVRPSLQLQQPTQQLHSVLTNRRNYCTQFLFTDREQQLPISWSPFLSPHHFLSVT